MKGKCHFGYFQCYQQLGYADKTEEWIKKSLDIPVKDSEVINITPPSEESLRRNFAKIFDILVQYGGDNDDHSDGEIIE